MIKPAADDPTAGSGLLQAEPASPPAPPRKHRRALILLERLLIAIAVISLGYYAYAAVEASLYQAYENRELDAILSSASNAPHRRGRGAGAP